jgi:hypothetical protein
VEELDDDSNLTSDILSDMNKVAFYFASMTNQLRQKEEMKSFSQLLEFFSTNFMH